MGNDTPPPPGPPNIGLPIIFLIFFEFYTHIFVRRMHVRHVLVFCMYAEPMYTIHTYAMRFHTIGTGLRYVLCMHIRRKNVRRKNLRRKNVHRKNVRCKNVRRKNVRCKNVRCKNVRRKNIRRKNVRRKNVRRKNVRRKNVSRMHVRR
jgi:hypothetical protein